MKGFFGGPIRGHHLGGVKIHSPAWAGKPPMEITLIFDVPVESSDFKILITKDAPLIVLSNISW
jgi:hypothetical protein